MNVKYGFLGSLVVLLLGTGVIAQSYILPPGLVQIEGPYPSTSCWDTDNGPNIYAPGSNFATLIPNVTTTTPDFCVSNEILYEGVCGSWIDATYGTQGWNSSVFGAVYNCSASNTAITTYGCYLGACVPISP